MAAACALALGLLADPRPSQAQDPLRVQARVKEATYYAGQGIDVVVSVVAEGERPAVMPPKIPEATVEAVDKAFRPIGVSGIGDATFETNAFSTRYRITPGRAGPLTIPPFVARLGGQGGASKPIRLTIHPLPLEGRPSSFLGGVGPVEARAEAVPASLRAGQAFEYRLHLSGLGAPGSTRWPILADFDRVPGLKVEPAGTEAVAEPPSRTFRYRARATEAGTLALPSVAVTTFHPEMARYVTTRAPGLAVRVAEVPRFDPSSLPSFEDESGAGPGLRGWPWTVPAALIVAAWGMIAVVRRRTSARRWARRVGRGLAREPGDAAARAAAGLRGYLARAGGHRGGELTPDEAAGEIARATGDDELAERARRLVEQADRARFGHAGEDGGDPRLAGDASRFFTDLARHRPRGGR